MFSGAPPDWGTLLPDDGAAQVLVDAPFTATFDRATGLAAAWLGALSGITALMIRGVTEPRIG